MKKPRFRLKVHDRYRIELKFDYTLRPQRAREDIRVDFFLFLPSSLDVNASTYPKDRFYQDMTTYTRYGTPGISFESLLDPDNALSPLTRIAALKAEWSADRGAERVAERISYELRVLGCVYRANARNQGRIIREMLSGALRHDPPAPGDFEDAVYLGEAFLSQAGRVTAAQRTLKRELLGLGLVPEVVQVFAYVDEAMSIVREGICGRLYRDFERVLAKAREANVELPRVRALLRRLAETMSEEEGHRRQSGYPSLVHPGADEDAARANEYFLYRAGVLKKYVQSVLFLNVRTQQGSRRLWYSLYALAAMSAMLFYIVLVIAVLGPAARLNSLSAILLAMVAYAFKDRIKEGMRHYFGERMTGWLHDREAKLIDRGPTRAVVGNSTEAFFFADLQRVPDPVLGVRGRNELAELAEEGVPETVMQYRKQTRFYARQVFQLHKRVSRLNEIVRLSVRSLLYRMDEPRKGLAILRSPAVAPNGESAKETDAPPERAAATVPGEPPPLKLVRASKVYHLNLVLCVSVKNDQGAWQTERAKYRLILSRDGIKRVEAADGAPPAAAS